LYRVQGFVTLMNWNRDKYWYELRCEYI